MDVDFPDEKVFVFTVLKGDSNKHINVKLKLSGKEISGDTFVGKLQKEDFQVFITAKDFLEDILFSIPDFYFRGKEEKKIKKKTALKVKALLKNKEVKKVGKKMEEKLIWVKSDRFTYVLLNRNKYLK